MRSERTHLVVFCLLALAGCDSPARNTSGELAGQAVASDEVKFRAAARQMYQGLLTPFCADSPALDRADVRNREADDVAALEASLRDTAAGYHLRIAREDIEQDKRGCRVHDTPAVAGSHVRTAREETVAGLKEVRRLSALGTLYTANESDWQKPNAAAFRSLVRQAVGNLLPYCPITSTATNVEVLAPARVAFDRYRHEIRSRYYARQFNMAEADEIYSRSQVRLKCPESGNEPLATLATAMLRQTRQSFVEMSKVTDPEL